LIAAAAGGLLSFVGNYFRTQETSLIALARGAVAGIVSVSAGLNDINPWAAVIIGAIGGIIYLVVTLTLKGTKIDDPAHAVSLHLVFIQINNRLPEYGEHWPLPFSAEQKDYSMVKDSNY